jgi:hypothetical protein
MPVVSGWAQTAEREQPLSMLRLPGPPAGPGAVPLSASTHGRVAVPFPRSAHAVAGQAGPACPPRLLAGASPARAPGRGPGPPGALAGPGSLASASEHCRPSRASAGYRRGPNGATEPREIPA